MPVFYLVISQGREGVVWERVQLMRQISCVVLALKQDRLLPLWSCTTPTLPADDSQNLNQTLTYMQVLFKLLFAFPFSFFPWLHIIFS